MLITNVSDVTASLSTLIEKVLHGQEVIITMAGKPVAKLVPYHVDTSSRELGVGNWKGQIWMADDFNDLPDDFVVVLAGAGNDEPTL